jgi:hypothetical protein
MKKLNKKLALKKNKFVAKSRNLFAAAGAKNTIERKAGFVLLMLSPLFFVTSCEKKCNEPWNPDCQNYDPFYTAKQDCENKNHPDSTYNWNDATHKCEAKYIGVPIQYDTTVFMVRQSDIAAIFNHNSTNPKTDSVWGIINDQTPGYRKIVVIKPIEYPPWTRSDGGWNTGYPKQKIAMEENPGKFVSRGTIVQNTNIMLADSTINKILDLGFGFRYYE